MSKIAKFVSVLILLLCMGLVNFIGSMMNWQLDMTDDQFYTLSPASLKIVEKIKHPVEFEFYYSKSSEGLPIRLKNFADRIERLLLQYQRVSNEKVRLKVIDPAPDSEEEDEAQRLGVHRQEVNADEGIYLGLAILQAGRSATIPLFNPQREKLLEYDISRELLRTQNLNRPKVGVLSPLQVMGDDRIPEDQQRMEDGTAEWEFVKELRSSFDLVKVDPHQSERLPSDLAALLLIHPEMFRPELLYSIDQFILSGKPTVLTVDPFNFVEDIRDRNDGLVMGSEYNKASRMPPFFQAWGVTMENGLLADLIQTTPIPPAPGETPTDYPLWLTIEAINRENPATAGLQLMNLTYVGALSLAEGSDVGWTPLLSSSDKAAVVDEALMREDPYTVSKKISPSGVVYTAAALIEGDLQSAFQETFWSGVPPRYAEALEPFYETGLRRSSATSSLAIIADTDFLHDEFAYRQADFQGQKRYVPRNDNVALIGNLLEYMLGGDQLIGLRGKSESLRPFTVVQEMKLVAQTKFEDQENEAIAALAEIDDHLVALHEKLRNRQSFATSREIRVEMKKAEREQVKFRKKLREIRKKFREDIQTLERRLGLLNVAAVPLLVVLAGILFQFARGRRAR